MQNHIISIKMWSNVERKITIPEFYQNKNVLITGGTGFVGKLLVEKLLRSCSGINKIYVLIRPKHGKSQQDRMIDATNDIVSKCVFFLFFAEH